MRNGRTILLAILTTNRRGKENKGGGGFAPCSPVLEAGQGRFVLRGEKGGSANTLGSPKGALLVFACVHAPVGWHSLAVGACFCVLPKAQGNTGGFVCPSWCCFACC